MAGAVAGVVAGVVCAFGAVAGGVATTAVVAVRDEAAAAGATFETDFVFTGVTTRPADAAVAAAGAAVAAGAALTLGAVHGAAAALFAAGFFFPKSEPMLEMAFDVLVAAVAALLVAP